MSDIRVIVERQAAWQKAQRDLPWPEKIRMAELIRDSIIKLRAARREAPAR